MHRIFREEGKAHGFNVWEDSIGNSFVGNISDEKEPHTLLGSHLDSVIEGGHTMELSVWRAALRLCWN